MNSQISFIDEKKLKHNVNCLINDFIKETGSYPKEVYLIAEGHSQLQAVKFEMKKQIF